MKKESRLDPPESLNWKRKRRSPRHDRHLSWYDSVLQAPRVWKYVIIASLLPAAAPFQPPSFSTTVLMRNVRGKHRGFCPNGRLRATVEDAITEEVEVEIQKLERSDNSTGYEPLFVAEYPERNGVEESKSVKEIWEHRHARSIQEGIRRETSSQLSSLLTKAKSIASDSAITDAGNNYAARTISGLIHALAEEAEGLDVEVETVKKTPLREKKVEEVRIQFSRLGFKPLRISGLNKALRKLGSSLNSDEKLLAAVCCPDEAFERIDVDKSGALDQEELSEALEATASTEVNKDVLSGLASQLLAIYDFNGDGVVDRGEYQSMVEDMAVLRKEQKLREQQAEEEKAANKGWRGMMKSAMKPFGFGDTSSAAPTNMTSSKAGEVIKELPDDPVLMDSMAKGEGSIVLSDLKLDLRRLLFGAVPLVKTITPGGPLILEPFTATLSGSFDANDVMESFLLDAGLRRLVARVLRRRVFFQLRDLLDGAVFYGRNWKVTSDHAPVVDVPKLEKVEFDKRDRMIITGRTLVRTSPDLPPIEQAFKVRCSIGSRANGRVIRLVDPELALVIECPKAWERNIVSLCKKLDLPVPTRPAPIYSYFPLYSKFKVGDKDGFDMGEDNRLKSIYIKDGALRFEMSAVLRPGRFLGNHYLAFTVPNRTFIITMERVREGIRAARKNKKLAKAARKKLKNDIEAIKESDDPASALAFNEPQKNGVSLAKPEKLPTTPSKSFFSRFVEGYLGSKVTKEDLHEIRTEQLTSAISDWFGRQGSSGDDEDSVDR